MKLIATRKNKGVIEKIGINWKSEQFIHQRKPLFTTAQDHGSSNFLNNKMLIDLLQESNWKPYLKRG